MLCLFCGALLCMCEIERETEREREGEIFSDP